MSDPSSESALIRLHAIVHGDVQGVGFRMATLREASALQLTGWVKNNWDYTVETVAEGPRSAIDAFERFLHRGPGAADVTYVDVIISTATEEFSGFNIRY